MWKLGHAFVYTETKIYKKNKLSNNVTRYNYKYFGYSNKHCQLFIIERELSVSLYTYIVSDVLPRTFRIAAI